MVTENDFLKYAKELIQRVAKKLARDQKLISIPELSFSYLLGEILSRPLSIEEEQFFLEQEVILASGISIMKGLSSLPEVRDNTELLKKYQKCVFHLENLTPYANSSEWDILEKVIPELEEFFLESYRNELKMISKKDCHPQMGIVSEIIELGVKCKKMDVDMNKEGYPLLFTFIFVTNNPRLRLDRLREFIGYGTVTVKKHGLNSFWEIQMQFKVD